MHHRLLFFLVFFITSIAISCKKEQSDGDCFHDSPTVRQIVNRQAVIKLTATIHPVYIIEQGAVDTKLIPCNFPMQFYADDLQVIISGEVKHTPQSPGMPCCTENFVITKITR